MIRTIVDSSRATLDGIAEEMAIRQTDELFILAPMGSQFDHKILQAMGRIGVFCLPFDPNSISAEDVQRLNPKGIIISGGPVSVHDSTRPKFDERIFDLGIPVLGICLGFQMWAQHVGCVVSPGAKRELGPHTLDIRDTNSPLFQFEQPREQITVIQSHGDAIQPISSMKHLLWCENALASSNVGHLWGVQFHPEVSHTDCGDEIFRNFAFQICDATKVFRAGDVAQQVVDETREAIGTKSKILLALSGGSDSSTVAYILGKAVDYQPGRIRAVYIKGVDRPEDEEHVRKYFGSIPWLELVFVDATTEFLRELEGKTTWKDKRLGVRVAYKGTLEQQIELLRSECSLQVAIYIAQGTLYTDIVESGGGLASGAVKARIKLHHNVDLGFSVPEIMPLSSQVKDTGRNIGRALGVPEELLTRHPFPGPGLVVRIEPEITEQTLRDARVIDGIFMEELRNFGLYDTVWQAGTVILNSISTATKGDDAAIGYCVAIWGKESVDGFTARWSDFTREFKERVSTRITNEVRGAARVLHDITNKPPGTIEWG
ncbi:MAG: hypothetical protein NTZ65_04230 [Candidatus Berkelbacteria bacterium]|nr:hypothetical protein [Candidatus Berkelbacteria bacterium]